MWTSLRLACLALVCPDISHADAPHGIWIDNRPGRQPSVVVADRANKRLQWFTLEGKHLKTLDGFILPANIDWRGEVLLVPDLSARITLLDRNDRVIAHLGEDPAWREQVLKDNMNGNRWGERPGEPGRFMEGEISGIRPCASGPH